ncbi:MAG: hypothetical protein IKO42_01565, partial [Opitutales bacterium]|nr:hypothetical protein [Opitutales bacterium]
MDIRESADGSSEEWKKKRVKLCAVQGAKKRAKLDAYINIRETPRVREAQPETRTTSESDVARSDSEGCNAAHFC